MRKIVFNAETRRLKDSERNSKWIEGLILHVYAAALRLYPAAFRAAFADEMKAVFAITIGETSGQMGFMWVLWREVCGLPLSLIAVYRQAHAQLPAAIRRRHNTRWFVRIMGGMLSVFLLSTLRVIVSPSYHLYVQAVPFVIALFIACICMLIGLCWGRVGGLLTIASGAAIGCCMSLYVYIMAVAEVGFAATVLIGLIWALPFLIFGILFYELSKQPKSLVTAVN